MDWVASFLPPPQPQEEEVDWDEGGGEAIDGTLGLGKAKSQRPTTPVSVVSGENSKAFFVPGDNLFDSTFIIYRIIINHKHANQATARVILKSYFEYK